jgi:hypothetical protein
MENTVTLQEFVTTHKQRAAAALLGVTQGAVSQMLNSDREIYIEYLSDGTCRAYEQKPVGRSRPGASCKS